jgi:hypothetical protein
MDSDNSDGAENQQERLIRLGWVIGFVDGEGCFSIGLVRQSGGPRRCGYKSGYQVAHEFAVTQGAQSMNCLHALMSFSGLAWSSQTDDTTTTGSTCIAMWCGAERT